MHNRPLVSYEYDNQLISLGGGISVVYSNGTVSNINVSILLKYYYHLYYYHLYYTVYIIFNVAAGPGFDGTSVIQTHMTNSRMTDPEVMETRFPVIVEESCLRRLR